MLPHFSRFSSQLLKRSSTGEMKFDLKRVGIYGEENFDTWSKSKRDILLNYLNSIDPHIKFTVEQPNAEGAIPFLDTLPQSKSENISVLVYRKPTHTDRYLDFNSSHPISATKSCG